MDFVHLHVHSEYSFPGGTCRLGELVKRAAQFRMPALALTDRDGLYGAIEFYKLAREVGIKPIIGCELTLLANYRLLLLVKNQQGYENLVQLVTHAHTMQNSGEPGVSQEILSRYAKGLIALDGYLQGEFGTSESRTKR